MGWLLPMLLGFTGGLIAWSQIGSTVALVISESRKEPSIGTPKWHAYLSAAFTPGFLFLVGIVVGVAFLSTRNVPLPTWALPAFKGSLLAALFYAAMLLILFRKKPKVDVPQA